MNLTQHKYFIPLPILKILNYKFSACSSTVGFRTRNIIKILASAIKTFACATKLSAIATNHLYLLKRSVRALQPQHFFVSTLSYIHLVPSYGRVCGICSIQFPLLL